MEILYKIKVLVADDHDLYLDGLRGFFAGNEVYEIVEEASNGEELVAKAARFKPHIVLTDLNMPLMSGTQAIRTLLKENPKQACLVLTNYENDFSIIEALEAGARGYITKNMAKRELFTALDSICAGQNYYCRNTSGKLARLLGKSNFNLQMPLKKRMFSDTERRIIQLICEEKESREIAELLFMSVRTVDNNRARILRKMNVRSSTGIVVYAIKNGMYLLDK
jgi:DNA-binding NarL/FixJ family response regulator